jgi:hypothetical protein
MGTSATCSRLAMSLSGLLILATLPACSDGKARTKQSTQESLCRAKESIYLNAAKTGSDDAISICVAEGLAEKEVGIAVRWRRGGETHEWACKASQCGDVLEYERYTRPQVTYLRLSFGSGDVRYAIEDDYPGDDPDFDPKAPPTVDVSATSKDKPDDFIFDEEYSLKTDRLGMMKLERYIEMKPMI